MRLQPRFGAGPLVAALVALCASPTVASMERSAIEESAATREYAIDSASTHRGYELRFDFSPAQIDRLRMAADAGRDGDSLRTLITIAASGNSLAQRAVGETLLRRGDAGSRAEGLRWLQQAAAGGDAQSALGLGRAYLPGAVTVALHDDARARHWLTVAYAATVTRPQAAYYLAVLDRAHQPVRAHDYFREAAELGVAEAMYQLANLYVTGEGTETDPREAMRWYLRAAALDHPAAIQELAYAFLRGDTLLPQSDLQAANMRAALEHALRHPTSAP